MSLTENKSLNCQLNELSLLREKLIATINNKDAVDSIKSQIGDILRAYSSTLDEHQQCDRTQNKILDAYINILNEGLFDDKHPQKDFIMYNHSFTVDELIYDLIHKLWSLGILTSHSCQGNPSKHSDNVKYDDNNNGYIAFYDKRSFVKFHDQCNIALARTCPYVITETGQLIDCSYDQALEILDGKIYCVYFKQEDIKLLTESVN